MYVAIFFAPLFFSSPIAERGLDKAFNPVSGNVRPAAACELGFRRESQCTADRFFSLDDSPTFRNENSFAYFNSGFVAGNFNNCLARESFRTARLSDPVATAFDTSPIGSFTAICYASFFQRAEAYGPSIDCRFPANRFQNANA